MTHLIITAAVYAVVIAVVWFALGCLVAFVMTRRIERRELEDHLTALAEAIGVRPGAEVELDAGYRSPIFDHIARVMAADVEREWEQWQQEGRAS
jgi:antibiotic biosynthesis monooxygenase (ABM) superfamily enzyme